MNDVAVVDLNTGELTQFRPEDVRPLQALHDARAALAARLGNMEALEREIDAKLDDQEDALNWWRSNVRANSRPKSNTESALLSMEEAQRLLGYSQQTVSKWSKKLAKRQEYRAQVLSATLKKAGFLAADNHRSGGTHENEWYTPDQYVEAARKVLGAIDLDPASSDTAQEKHIHAAEYFTAQNDGLGREWHGRVWLNPPYAQPAIQNFVEKLVTEVSEGRVSHAILLTHNYTDTAWFHHAAHAAQAICFTRGRIAFLDPDGEPASPTQGQAFFYFGDAIKKFRDVFRDHGFVVKPA